MKQERISLGIRYFETLNLWKKDYVNVYTYYDKFRLFIGELFLWNCPAVILLPDFFVFAVRSVFHLPKFPVGLTPVWRLNSTLLNSVVVKSTRSWRIPSWFMLWTWFKPYRKPGFENRLFQRGRKRRREREQWKERNIIMTPFWANKVKTRYVTKKKQNKERKIFNQSHVCWHAAGNITCTAWK